MSSFRFIHAADLHLDAAMSGIGRDVSHELASRLHDATFVALERLMSLCLHVRADALLLAGDLYNHEDGSLRAQLALRNGCQRLAEAGISVFIVHGNHDPLQSRVRSLQWPDNTFFFGAEYTHVPLIRNDRCIAMIHGISHNSEDEKRNLAQLFTRTEDAVPQIGLLHCTLGTADGKQRYAPCSTENFVESGLDYWALGHIHQFSIVHQAPFAIYPGSLQGLHIGEEKNHGCVIVDMDSQGNASPRFYPLAPIIWHQCTIDIEHGTVASARNKKSSALNGIHTNGAYALTHSAARSRASLGVVPEKAKTAPLVEQASSEHGADSNALHDAQSPSSTVASSSIDDVDTLESFVLKQVEQFSASLPPRCTDLLVRLTLTGRGKLNTLLRRPNDLADLTEHLRDVLANNRPACWLKDIHVTTQASRQLPLLRERDDLLGATLQEAHHAIHDEDLLMTILQEDLSSLYEHYQARKILPALDAATLALLAEDASQLCIDLLESE